MKAIGFLTYCKNRLRSTSTLAIVGSYVVLCLASAVVWCVRGHVRSLAMSVAFAVFVPLIFLLEYVLKFKCGELFLGGVLTLSIGSLLGSCFNLYTYLPFLDTVLHGMSGILFGCFGFTLAQLCFGEAKEKRKFFGCLLFAVCFSLAVAVVWELFEYACTCLLGVDMMEDTFVTEIHSYLLSGSHAATVDLEGIRQTVIYYGDGQTYTISGYLDIGLIDTLADMTVCTVGAVLFAIAAALGFKKFPKLRQMLIPQGQRDTE